MVQVPLEIFTLQALPQGFPLRNIPNVNPWILKNNNRTSLNGHTSKKKVKMKAFRWALRSFPNCLGTAHGWVIPGILGCVSRAEIIRRKMRVPEPGQEEDNNFSAGFWGPPCSGHGLMLDRLWSSGIIYKGRRKGLEGSWEVLWNSGESSPNSPGFGSIWQRLICGFKQGIFKRFPLLFGFRGTGLPGEFNSKQIPGFKGWKCKPWLGTEHQTLPWPHWDKPRGREG